MKTILLIAITILLCNTTRAEDPVMTVRNSRYKGQWYESQITATQLSKIPQWNPLTTDEAPLPAGEAAQLAWRELERILPKKEILNWCLSFVELRQTREMKWYYAVHILNTGTPAFADIEATRLKCEYFTILVLMNGETCPLFPVAKQDKGPEPTNPPYSSPAAGSKR